MSRYLFQSLPFLQFALFSNRIEGLSFKDVSLWSLGLYDILCLFIPNGGAIPYERYILPYIGQQMVTSLYIGILPLIFAIFASFWGRGKFLYFWGCISIFSIILAGGKHLGLYYLFYKFLPGFSMLRDPVKALHLFSFSASILAGFGFNQIFSKDIRKGLLLFLFLFLIFFLCFKWTPILFEVIKTLNPPFRINLYEIEVWRAFVSLNCLKVAIFLLGFYILISLKERLSSPLFYWAIISLTLFDLWTFNGSLHCMIDERFYREPPEEARFIEDGRFYHFSPSKMIFYLETKISYPDFVITKKMLCGNIGMIFGLYALTGYESIYLSDIVSFLGLPKDILWKITGVRYVISDKFYINPYSLPRAVFFSTCKVVDRKNILRYMASSEFFPEKEVVLEEEPGKEHQSTRAPEKVKIVRYEPNKVVIEVKTSSNGLLFLSDTYYPEWKAYIDGKETKIYRANYCFRAIHLEKGRHIVEFRYFPKTFIIGLIASLTSFVIVMLYWKFGNEI